ncbi:jg3184 [Pararge aegeria aegeria]|uniref:Jg3184 protein n=1 Tax=Pararge aegeria aegeria TaxID=348720 RepID=A0A8S4QZQ1_9NEOP|nr:jg3184 [Pararge aegeria aegeria]
MGGAHSSKNRWTLGYKVLEWRLRTVNGALVGLERGGQTTTNESLRAAENRRHRTVDFGTPYKRPMPSCGLQSVEVITTNC